MISRYFVCCESNVIGSEALRSFLTNASCCLQRSHTHRLECHSQLERPEGSDAGECGSFSQVTNPLRNAFSALAASGQISMLICPANLAAPAFLRQSESRSVSNS